MFYRSLVLASICLLPLMAHAVGALPSQQAFSGAVLTPNAQVLPTGEFAFTFAKGQAYRGQIRDLDSLQVAVGLMPGLEASGRIVTDSYDCNLYFEDDCYIRDLSASAKYQLPLWTDSGWNFAVGVQDLEGAANHFGAYYGVADYQFESLPVRISAGIGSSDLPLGILDGAFGSIEYQPFDFMQLVAEHDGGGFNAAVKLLTPEGLLPYGARMTAGYQLYSEHRQDVDMWQASVSVPLLGVHAEKPKRTTLTQADKLAVQQRQADTASSHTLMQALADEGFINLRVGLYKQQPLITFENRRYNHSPVDGVGVALGIVSSYLGEDARAELGAGLHADNFTLVQLVNGEPVQAVFTGSQCYREFLSTGAACRELRFTDSQLPQMLEDVDWKGEETESSFGRSQLIVMPMLRHALATEYGVFDYSLALGFNLYTNLWDGAAVDLRYVAPLATSDDYDTGYWRNAKHDNKLDRALFHQAFRFDNRITTQFSAGMIFGDYLGVMNETRWTSSSGRHSVGWEISHFEHQDSKITKNTLLGRYSLQIPEYSWQLGVEAGEFWNGDRGAEFSTTHWLGDVSLKASYLIAQDENSDVTEQFVGVSFNIPLTFWRDMKPGYLQVRGADQFSFNVQTRVGDRHNNLNTGMGNGIDLQHDLSRHYYFRDRFGPAYYDGQESRLRGAYLRYLDTVL